MIVSVTYKDGQAFSAIFGPFLDIEISADEKSPRWLAVGKSRRALDRKAEYGEHPFLGGVHCTWEPGILDRQRPCIEEPTSGHSLRPDRSGTPSEAASSGRATARAPARDSGRGRLRIRASRAGRFRLRRQT